MSTDNTIMSFYKNIITLVTVKLKTSSFLVNIIYVIGRLYIIYIL
jgi:hypothetical protein